MTIIAISLEGQTKRTNMSNLMKEGCHEKLRGVFNRNTKSAPGGDGLLEWTGGEFGRWEGHVSSRQDHEHVKDRTRKLGRGGARSGLHCEGLSNQVLILP